MKSKKILVTGADGFIGSHLVEALVRSGYSVKAFVLYNSFNSWGWLDDSPKEIIDEIEVFAGDIRDPNGVKAAMTGCASVYHLAALIGIPYSYHSPDTYVDTNIKGTLNILQAARDIGISRLVHTSTSEVYGTAKFVPITEEHPLQGQSPYSASKIGADQLAHSFFTSFELPVITIRPFNTYGPRQSARAIIPSIISQVASGKTEISIGSISPTRDFNFISDTVSGFMAAMDAERAIGEVINIGSNYEISIGDLVNLVASLMGKNLILIHKEERFRPKNSEVERLWADNSKAKRLIGWEPEFSGVAGLEKGLLKTIEWFSNIDNLKRYKVGNYSI